MAWDTKSKAPIHVEVDNAKDGDSSAVCFTMRVRAESHARSGHVALTILGMDDEGGVQVSRAVIEVQNPDKPKRAPGQTKRGTVTLPHR